MTNGFLNDLPDLDMPGKRRKKKSPGQGAPKSEDKVIYYMRLRCPKCGGLNVPVYDSGHLPIRYHKCAECGHTFKSIEK